MWRNSLERILVVVLSKGFRAVSEVLSGMGWDGN
jgi:hypothetical protein